MAKKVIKNAGEEIRAYELGKGNEMEKKLIDEGKIWRRPDGVYVFYKENISGNGDNAHVGDFFKVDGNGFPYLMERIWFDAHHRHIEEERYEEIPTPLDAWEYGDVFDEFIEYLIFEKGLILDSRTPDKCFRAKFGRRWKNASKDAVVVFKSITRNNDGNIIALEFDFVERGDFEKNYSYC